MVKADPTRNYYADLRVSANASENEIRKAFRTLALQYHPDRNPGREVEYVVKYQEIQAAHEVLCDPSQRTKYDTERRKYRNLSAPMNAPNTPRAKPPPIPQNAYTTTTPSETYHRAPLPKSPPQAQRPPLPRHHNTYNTGADSSTNKNSRLPPTAQRPELKVKDVEARTNVSTAWQKMKQPQGEEPQQYNPSAQNSSQNTPQNNPNKTPFGRNQSIRIPSPKYEFDSSTSGVDERQARSANRNYARPSPTRPNPTTPPHATPNYHPKDTQTDPNPKASIPQIGTSKTRDESEASRPKNRACTEEPQNGEPDAMNINSCPQPVKKVIRAALTSQKLNTTAVIDAIPNDSATVSPSATTAKPPGGGLKRICSDSGKSLVAPQTNGTSGLASVDDALPFQSHAFNSHPVKSNSAQSLKFPQIPAHASKQHDAANTGFSIEDVVLVARLPVPTGNLDVLTASDAFIQYTEDEVEQAGDYTSAKTKDIAPSILPDKRDDPSHYKSLEKPHSTAIVLQQKTTLQDPIFALSLPLLVDKILRHLPLPILEPIVSPGKVRVYWTPVCCSVPSI
jgi:curved DNA-binding protein CbpA